MSSVEISDDQIFDNIDEPGDPLSGSALPHNLEVERALLGGLMLAPDSFDLIEGRLQEEDFFSPIHAKVFSSLHSLRIKQQPFDLHLIINQLKAAGDFEIIGGIPGLASIIDAPMTGAHVEHYFKIVEDLSILRRLIKSSLEIIEAAKSDSASATEVVEKAEHSIFDIATKGSSGDVKSAEEVLKNAWDKIESHLSEHAIITGLETGFSALDQQLTGLHSDELIIVAGRPAMGKSTFALNVLRKVVTESKLPAVLFTLEMSAENIVRNMLAAEGRIEGQKLRTLYLTSEDRSQLTLATATLSSSPLWIDETPAISLSELRGKARRLKLKHDIRLIVIDYLQLMTASSTARGRSREQEVSEISRGLKALAKELHIPIVALSQLSRKPEGRQDSRPILSDLRESGAIEQDADVVLMLHRPEYYDKDDKPGEAEIIIAKQRNGPTGSVDLAFISKQLRFENISFDTRD